VNRRAIIVALLTVVLVAGVGYALYAKTASAVAPDVIVVAGDVRIDENIVRAPQVTYPTPDYTVGIPTAANAQPSTKKRTTTASASRLPVVSGFLSEVLVAQGDHVTKGQVVARLDATMLDLGVRQAQTALDRARANLDVLDANLSTITDSRATLVKTRADLVKARASLAATITVLEHTKASLETSIAAIQQLIAQPGGPPPHVPPYPVLLQQLRGALAGVTQGLAGARTGLARMNAGIKKLDAGLVQIGSGRTQLVGIRKLALVTIDAARVALKLAEAARDQASIVAPVDGVVTYTRTAGTAVMVGAPILRIRPDGPTHVYTYLTADQLARVDVGSKATVTFDSNTGAPLVGHISDLGHAAVVPPTSFPTSIVHMTRAVRVTIELDGASTAPPGTPVDIEITTSR